MTWEEFKAAVDKALADDGAARGLEIAWIDVTAPEFIRVSYDSGALCVEESPLRTMPVRKEP